MTAPLLSSPPADDCSDRPESVLSVLQSAEFQSELLTHLQYAALALSAEFAAFEAPDIEFAANHGLKPPETQWQCAGTFASASIDISLDAWRLTRESRFGRARLSIGGFLAPRAPSERDWRLFQLAADAIERQFYWVSQQLRTHGELLRLRKAIDAVGAGIWQVNFALDRFQGDENVARVLGASSSPMHGNLAEFLSRICPEDQGALRAALDRSLLTGNAERVFFRAKFNERWLSAGFVCERDGEGGGKLIGLMRDYHRQKAAEVELELHQQQLESLVKQLRRNNRIDPLTGIANRIALDERLRTEVLRARSKNQWLTIFMIDVDHFKGFNDSFGHLNGDAALKQTANCIVAALPKDDLAVRFGGEEFCAMASADPDVALELAERLRVAVEQAAWSLRPITVSIGFCCMHGPEIDQGLLFQRADAALYRAKAAGRNRVAMAGARENNDAPLSRIAN